MGHLLRNDNNIKILTVMVKKQSILRIDYLKSLFVAMYAKVLSFSFFLALLKRML